MSSTKKRAPRNRTLTIDNTDIEYYKKNLFNISSNTIVAEITNKTIQGDSFKVLNLLPDKFVDLMVVDPPYNLTKSFNGSVFKRASSEMYENWLDSWVKKTLHTLKDTASIYVCCDWQSSSSVQRILEKYLIVRNRIIWEREKGRGAKSNWKNCSEDIWFCTVSDNYYFDVEAVKIKRKVIAPYRDLNKKPKDWNEEEEGNFRVTCPSNFWSDISIPFWSMPENTDHPTQKSEKLIAKLILASSKKGDFVFDPFLGSGTTSVVAKKLERNYVGIEQEEHYCCLSEKRLEMAEYNKDIQGYSGGYFWERNTLAQQSRGVSNNCIKNEANQASLFD